MLLQAALHEQAVAAAPAGHVAALYVNKLRVAGLLHAPVDAHFEALFETGVDEMRWDDVHQGTGQWPAVADVTEYRRRVYAAVAASTLRCSVGTSSAW